MNDVTLHIVTDNNEPYIPKEISWLDFNQRVLQEAANKQVPLIERLRYLGIFSNNLDEFFRVRVADVRRLIAFSASGEKAEYKQLLQNIQNGVIKLQDEFELVYNDVIHELQKRGIYLVNEKQIDARQAAFVERFFLENVLPELDPIMLSDNQSIPALNDESIYLAISLKHEKNIRYALIEVPTPLVGRFIQIPKQNKRRSKVFIVLDNIIRHCLPAVFRGLFPIDSYEAYTIKFTRDAEIRLDEGITQTFIDKMSQSLKQRSKADAVRFVYDEAMPAEMLSFLTRCFKVGKYDSQIAGGRYHNSKDFMSFPNVGPKYLEFKPLPQILVKAIRSNDNLFSCIREKDILLYYPYHSFSHIVELLRTAAIDPAVTEIKMCLYRVARNSRIIDALINAVHNQKQVTVVVELQARFDEQANISWAQRLTEGGVNVIFGIPGIKIHSKLIQISRIEQGKTCYYSHIGTGNFNEKTARLYTDFSLLTCHQEIGEEVAKVFDFLQYTYRRHKFNRLMVSPHTTRPEISRLIEQETENARKGLPAEITIKCNNLVDRQIISKLYKASSAGVSIRLIIRGMCSLVPGVPGVSENIRAISIVDRYLEHPRVYSFHNNGVPKIYIGSADLMTRNLDYRVEVCCPIYDEAARKTIMDILEIQWNDNVKARIINRVHTNQMVKRKSGPNIRSQEAIQTYLASGKLPRFTQKKVKPKKLQRRKNSHKSKK
ncbi:MAG: polyphosphate kinase 1 [Pseudomonadales bacterium]|nr:polyphosphate kinase 1 [Pseudomonadales bacterium]